jgi:DNA-binding NarL/FixJ family response regulator
VAVSALPSPVHTRVLLADEAGSCRTALAEVLAAMPGVELVDVTAGGQELRDALVRLRPDVLVIDDRLLRDRDWRSPDAGLRVIVVGVDDDPAYAARADRLGAVAWLPKERADLLVAALFETGGAVGKYGPGPRSFADDRSRQHP